MNDVLLKKENVSHFEDLIAPYSLQDFSENYWDKKPLIIQRDDRSYFESLLTLKNMDELLDYHRPKGSRIRIVKNQEHLDKSKYENTDGSLKLNQIYASYADGYTLVVNEIDSFWKPIKTLCHNMRDVIKHKTVVNMYLTPKNEKALLPHYDTHDVFVVQVSGKKHWRLYDADYPSPLVKSFQPIFQREHLKNVQEITVNAGDIMYIPRGVPHEAYTTDESSLHLTIGVYATQWLDLIVKSLEGLANSNIALRNSLPLGFLNNDTLSLSEEQQQQLTEILGQLLNGGAKDMGLALIGEEFRTEQQPMSDGHFTSLDHLNELTAETYLEKRERMHCKTQVIGPMVRIIFSGNVIKGPMAVASTFDYVANVEGSFQIKDLPIMGNDNKIKIATRLIRGGLLKVIS